MLETTVCVPADDAGNGHDRRVENSKDEGVNP